MVFDPNILSARMEVNLINLVGSVYDGILASGIVDMHVESEADYLWNMGCRNCGAEPGLNFGEFFQRGAELLPHLLQQEYPEVFGNLITGEAGAIAIESVGTAKLSSDYFMRRDYVPATIAVDRDKLSALVAEHGANEFCDGRNLSGFIRTAEDDYWTICQVVPAIMESFAGADCEDFWLVDPLGELASEMIEDNADEELAEKYECPVHSESSVPWGMGR